MRAVAVGELIKDYGAKRAVAGISFVAPAGQLTTLLGPSGCGKTTTLRCIAGLETPVSGEITFGNERIYSSSQGVNVPVERRGVGMVFQSYAVWPHMTVFENVAFGLKVRRVPRAQLRERVMRSLDMVHLAQRAQDSPSQLSGGQQQRVALARALAYDPEIFLLDEPLANLDARLRDEMRFELREIQRRTGVTALYVTHDQSEAMVLSDQIVVMHEGRIEQVGRPSDIYERPRTEFVASFIGSGSFIPVGHVASENDHFVAATPFGALEFIAGADAAGTARKLFVRSEDLRILPDHSSSAARNVWSGVVVSRTYLGERITLVLTSAGVTLRADVSRQATYREGDTVTVTVDPLQLVPVAAAERVAGA